MTVQRFKTRPVEIDAIRFTGDNFQEIRDWTRTEEAGFRERNREMVENYNDFPFEVYDKLHEAWIPVAYGQWIIKGLKGEFYPCDDETLHGKYEEVVVEANGPMLTENELMRLNDIRRQYGLDPL